MRIALNARIVGAAAGLAAGLLFVIGGWRVWLIMMGFLLAGYAVGVWIDPPQGLMRWYRRHVDRIFRS